MVLLKVAVAGSVLGLIAVILLLLLGRLQPSRRGNLTEGGS
jgi:putative effector of murein hydrolase LrgA (UPF0299 family)